VIPGLTSGSRRSTTSCEQPKRMSAWEGATSARATSEFHFILKSSASIFVERCDFGDDGSKSLRYIDGGSLGIY